MYYIYEHQTRPDGQVNIQPVVARTSFASGLSYYYERLSKMTATTLFTSVSVMLVDANLVVLEKKTVDTLYEPPVEEQVETPTEGTTDA